MQQYKAFTLFCFLSFFHAIASQAQVDPGVDFNLQKFLDKAFKSGDKDITIPPGRYRVAPQGQTHLMIKDLQDVTIIADGVEMICTETVQAININNCTNLKIQGLIIDYDPLPFTQGKIVEISEDKTKLTVDILDGYETNLRNDKLEIYDPETAELVTRTYYGVTHELDRKNRRVVFSKKSSAGVLHSFEEIGDIVVFDSYNNRFTPHAIMMNDNENLVLENVRLYAGTTFAFFERSCNGTIYIGCHVDRRLPENDLKKREVRRMRSNNADGFHSKSAQIGPSYRNCIARYNGDDGYAISGLYHVITETSGNKITVVGKAGRRPDINVTDPVELVSYDGTRIPDAYVRSIKPGRALNDKEIDFLSTQKFLAESKKTKDAKHVWIIEVNREIDLPLGSVIASAGKLGNGFKIVNCVAGPNRSRGIIAKSSNGTIAFNKLVDNWGMGIKCSPEHQWLEAGSGNNLTIANNVVKGCHDVGIAVYAKGGNGKMGAPGAHNNIRITNNMVIGSVNPGFGITSTIGLTFLDNKVMQPDNSFAEPWRKDFGRRDSKNRLVYLKNVKNIEENFGLDDQKK